VPYFLTTRQTQISSTRPPALHGKLQQLLAKVLDVLGFGLRFAVQR
jgi:hypothetical protein